MNIERAIVTTLLLARDDANVTGEARSECMSALTIMGGVKSH